MLQNMYVRKPIRCLLVLSALTLSLTSCVGHTANPAERKTLTMKVDDSNKIEASSAKAGCQWKKRRILYNSDGHNAFLHCYPPESPDFVRRHVDEVLNTQVDTFLVCPNVGMRFTYPSQVGKMIGQGATPEEYASIQAKAYDPTSRWSMERSIVNLRLLVEGGHDPIGLMVDRAREKKLEVFITFRLNDAHGLLNPEKEYLRNSDFWREHPEWRTQIGVLNFEIPQVRQRRLAELTECCQRYDIDGLELDFLRAAHYFPEGTGPKNIEVMTAFVKSVREMTERVGKKRGRPLLLAARVCNTLAECELVGLDPVGWAKEGFIDFLTASEYLFTREESRIPEFKAKIKNIPIYGDIQLEYERKNPDGSYVLLTPADYRRVAKNHFQAGADGILLFNYPTVREYGFAGTTTRIEPCWEVLYQIGSLETIQAVERLRADQKNE